MIGEAGSTADGATILVTVNGSERSVAAGSTLVDLIRSLDMNPELIVVEHNFEILDRKTYGDVVLSQDDRVELVHFVGGG